MSRLPFITIADTKNMKKALLSVCLGADSTAVAWSKHPEEFSEIQAMVMLQPVSGRYIVEEFVKSIGVDDGYEKFDKAVYERTGFHLSEQSPLEHVGAVTVPTLVAQVHDDTMTRPQDVQDIYDAIPVAEKSLYWIGCHRCLENDLALNRSAHHLRSVMVLRWRRWWVVCPVVSVVSSRP